MCEKHIVTVSYGVFLFSAEDLDRFIVNTDMQINVSRSP